jgi:hypothetical protein
VLHGVEQAPGFSHGLTHKPLLCLLLYSERSIVGIRPEDREIPSGNELVNVASPSTLVPGTINTETRAMVRPSPSLSL